MRATLWQMFLGFQHPLAISQRVDVARQRRPMKFKKRNLDIIISKHLNAFKNLADLET
jgi:hypothetical protein